MLENHANYRFKKHTRGFTIVELLIVIVVIGILAAITIVAYNGIQQRAKIAQQSTALTQYVKAFSLYIAEKGEYPYLSTNPTGSVACVYAASANCDSDAGYNASLTTTLADNLAPYIASPLKFNNKVAVNYSTLTGPSGNYTGVYFYVLYSGDIECPSIGSVNLVNKTAGNPTACRYRI